MHTSIRTQNQQTKSKQAAPLGGGERRMRRRVGGRGGDVEAVCRSIIGRSGHCSWRGGHMPPVMDEFTTCHRLGRGWSCAVGRWRGDPMLPQEGVLGLTRERPCQNILLTILHHNKGIETCFSRRRNLTVAKKGIETCFNTHRNLKR
jgi:hypothetical protein